MKILITADIHNGVAKRMKDCLWCLKAIREYAQKEDIEHIIIAGDFFHDRSSLDIDVLNAAYDEVRKAMTMGQRWIVFPGNHDMFLKTSWQINSIHCLSEVMTVLEKETEMEIGGKLFHFLPFIHYESQYLEHFKAVNDLASEGDILVTHIGVKNAVMNSCFLLKYWKDIDLEDSKFSKIFTGHFHCHQQVGDKIWYPGSPLAFKFDEGMVPHGFIVYDTETDKVEFVTMADASPDGYRPPDFLTIPEENLLENAKHVTGNHIRILWSNPVTANELAKVKEILKAKGALSVKWGLVEKEIKEVKETQGSLDIASVNKLFETWVKEDDPKLDQGLLLEIHKKVASEAEERFVVEETFDD
jgi:DNA repair exonuclease SbcCD nuclease subunit